MEDYGGEWGEFIRRLARELAPLLVPALVEEISRVLAYEIRRQLCMRHFRRFRYIENLSEKLVYRHLIETQPDTFTGIRRPLDMEKKTLSRALKGLTRKGFIVQDEWNRYWTTEPGEKGSLRGADGRRSPAGGV